MKEKSLVELYTDGACSGNPGPGGYGLILRYVDQRGVLHEKEQSEGFPETTNNRMELLAVLRGLERLKRPCRVEIYSDSQYVVKAIEEGWLRNWVLQGFRAGKKNEVKNIDLWEQLIPLLHAHETHFHWVKGHAENELNNRCDRLAVEAYRKFLEKGENT
ncbi:MAG: ribonuclease HI [Lachnospiraceae bacterium]|nr:ribonuclease HI [Lachnospiraceae bacterium]MBQ6541599.1 ribonuclease HI [Lachnospiraceae bacterium]MBQ7601988.1 ribonuclease HI [Lachnospiraceae bacterium]MBR5340062.1 ribonuclease HI [Lachnospiraceae bacterium]